MANRKVTATVALQHDKAAAAETDAAIQKAAQNTKALEATNEAAAKSYNEAAAAAEKSAKANKLVADSLQQIDRNKALDELAEKYGKIVKEGGDAAKATQELQEELKKLGATDKEVDRVASAFDRVRNAADQPISSNDRFDQVSRDVGLAGDAESAARTIGGAAGFFGGKGIEQGLAGAGELFATLEALPRLKAAAQGLPDVLGAAGSALGPVGIGLGAVALLAAVAFSEASKSIQQEADRITALAGERLSLAERLADGLSTEDAQADLEKNAAIREQITIELDRAQQEYNQFLAKQPDILGNAGDNLLKTFDAREDALAAAVDNAKNRLKELDASTQAIQEAIDSGRTTTGQAVEAEKALAQVRGQGAATAVDSAAKEFDRAAEAQKKAAAEQQRIAEQAAQEQQRQAEEAVRKQEEAEKRRYEIGVRYSDKLVDIARGAADKAEDNLRNLEETLNKNKQSFFEDINKLSVDANRKRLEDEIAQQQQEATDLREHARKLESIRDDAIQSESDALRRRNFLEANRIREQAIAALEAENKAFETGQSEKQIVQDEARAKESRELENARNDRLAALQKQNADAREAYEQRLREDEIGRQRAERDAAIQRDRDLRATQEHGNALLGIKQQQSNMELQIAQQTFQGISALAAGFHGQMVAYGSGGTGGVTNNNNSRNIRDVNIPVQGLTDPRQVQQIVLETFGSLGFV